MNLKRWSSPVLSLWRGRNHTALIRSGESDDDLCYQASIKNFAGQELLVAFHPSSMMLERVRLVGSIAATIELSCGSVFKGVLKLSREVDHAGDAALVTLAVELHTQIAKEMWCDQGIRPLT